RGKHAHTRELLSEGLERRDDVAIQVHEQERLLVALALMFLEFQELFFGACSLTFGQARELDQARPGLVEIERSRNDVEIVGGTVGRKNFSVTVTDHSS